MSRGISDSLKITITIAGPKKTVMATLKAMDGIKHVDVLKKLEDDVWEYTVDSDKDVDIRKMLFFEFAKLGYPIMGLKTEEIDLEEVFREYTTKAAGASTHGHNSPQQDSPEKDKEQDVSKEDKGVE